MVNMNKREVSCAFIVCKVCIGGKDYLVLRRDSSWEDLNFIGGHQEPVDEGNYLATAMREVEEELPELKKFGNFELVPLTGETQFGPVWSVSAKSETLYKIRFFLLKFIEEPIVLNDLVSHNTPNVFVSQEDITLRNEASNISQLVQLLESSFPGGISAIPHSWGKNITNTHYKFIDKNRMLDKSSLLKRWVD